LGLREWGFFYYPNACAKGGCNFQMVYHGCMENSEKTLDLYAPWAASNDLILVAPQAVDCWGVLGGNIVPITDKSYFSKDYTLYQFSKNIIKAISSPIDNKYDYNQNQNLEALSTYPEELFLYMGVELDCKEFMNQDCVLSGDCFMKDPATGKWEYGLKAFGILEAEEGQCDSRSSFDKMKDEVKERMFSGKDGSMKMMESAQKLAISAAVVVTTSMTLY
jgi:hypothetical protein